MEYRPWYLAKEWTKLGHCVTIVAASYSHLRAHQPELEGACRAENREGIKYIWLRTPRYSGNGSGRIINMATFIAQLYRFLPRIARDAHPDAVIASSTYPLDAYPARWIAQKTGAKFIFELHDLWPLSPMELGKMSPRHPFIRVMQRAEDYWCQHADRVISILPHADRHLVTRGMAPEKFVHVPNGIDLSEWETPQDLPPTHQTFLNEARQREKFCLCFAGAHGVANALHVLLDVAELLQSDSAIQIVLVGQGPEKAALQQRMLERGLQNVSFLPPLPKKAIPTWLRQMDCLYIGLQRCSLFSFGISPNKMFDYMMAGKPVVNAIKASNNPVADTNCGVTAEAENPQSIAEAILKIYHTPPEERRAMGERGKAYVLSHHTYPVLAQQFIEALER